jgi:trk system potassium uptake protein TrkH
MQTSGKNWSNSILWLRRAFYQFNSFATKWTTILIPLFWSIAFIWAMYDLGFNSFESNAPLVNSWLTLLLRSLTFLHLFRWLLELYVSRSLKSRLINLALFIVILILYNHVLFAKILSIHYDSVRYLIYKVVLYGTIIFFFFSELSYVTRSVFNKKLNPSLLFVSSFILLIIFGALMLHLPNATKNGLGFLDALFTATSAVCVSGLSVTNIAQEFTQFGQIIILLLMQIGGLGIMTFAGMLSYAMAGSLSLKHQFAFRDMFQGNANNVGKLVSRIVWVSLFFEISGAVMIYFTLDKVNFERVIDKIFFSVFHSISAYCNAGISTFDGGLYHPALRFNYSMHFIIALLIILGGIGFPIVFNLFTLLRIKAKNLVWKLQHNAQRIYRPRVVTATAILSLVTTAILLIIGFVAFITLEQNGSLAEHPTWTGKIVTSFFSAVTPRTAGFNTVDINHFTLPMLMLYILLMWIGASPGSTGGGIKTTTAAIAFLNLWSFIKGRDRVEFYKTEISHQSIRHVLASIVLSLLIIGACIFLLNIQDSQFGLVKITFEAFAAFSTTGLTMGITHELSDFGKWVILITMFVGRVGAITVLIAVVKQSSQLLYRYPKEDILC